MLWHSAKFSDQKVTASELFELENGDEEYGIYAEPAVKLYDSKPDRPANKCHM